MIFSELTSHSANQVIANTFWTSYSLVIVTHSLFSLKSEWAFGRVSAELQGFEQHWACPVRLASTESVTPVFNLSFSLDFHCTHSCMFIDHFQPTNLYSQFHTCLWESPLNKCERWWTVACLLIYDEAEWGLSYTQMGERCVWSKCNNLYSTWHKHKYACSCFPLCARAGWH